MVVAFGNLSTFSWKQVIRVLGISFVAIMCATLGWFVYQSWRFVWTMESVVAGTLIPEEQATIINQAEAIRQQLELDIKPSLDNSYPLASTETLDLVTGRWQIIEDWDNGLCWYSWGRTQREGRHELRVMEISDHFIVTSIQHPWDHEPQIERSIKSNADRIGVIDKTESQLAVHKTLVVFDADGPMTFLSQSASDIQNGQFEGSVRGFPANVTNGFVSRGIIAPDSDRLYLFGTSEDEVGQNLPNPEWVPLRPHVAGTHLTVLRRFSADWKYLPDGIDIEAVEKKFRSTTPRYIGDNGPLWDEVTNATTDNQDHQKMIPLGDVQKYHKLNEMPTRIREIYENSLKQYENP